MERYPDEAPPVRLGCYQPMPLADDEPAFVVDNLFCEFAADLFPVRFDQPSNLRRALVGHRTGARWPVPDERGYGPLKYYPSPTAECSDGIPAVRCCLDL